MKWLPNPPDGTAIGLGFDGSDVDDWTAIRAETIDTGFQFTPRVFEAQRPTVWNPAEHHDHRIPRLEVHAALEEVFDRWDVRRFYYDPPGWKSEGEAWEVRWGAPPVVPWETYKTRTMFEALERFTIDLTTSTLSHDGCPITARHVGNAVKVMRGRDTYGLAKASHGQKIDVAVTSVLAHEAACDARAAGAPKTLTRVRGHASAR